MSEIRREPSPFASLFPAEVLSVRLEDGSELVLFVKHLGEEQAEHPDKQCRDREIRVYEELLGESALPVASYYGWSRAANAGRRDLFLEYLPGWDLRYQELEHWYAAARRLAEMHTHFSRRVGRLSRCDYLLRVDAAYLRAWAARALDVVMDCDRALGVAFDRVVREYGRVAEALQHTAPTLVHNDLAPKNVVVDRHRRPARIAFVDWELAGIGCGLLDLVNLDYGLDPASRARMRAAYFDGLGGSVIRPADGALERVIAAAELHRTVYRIAHSATWSLPAATVRQWVAESLDLLDSI